MLSEYDIVRKPGSQAIVTLEDDDQEFIDSWVPDVLGDSEEPWLAVGAPIPPEPQPLTYSEVAQGLI